MKKKILIIAFKFPPYPEVGAYRWTKFSKYFADKGNLLHIITVNWKNKKKQTWYDDVIHENIIIHKIPSLGFHNFKYHKFPPTFFGWLLNKFRNQILKILNLFYFIDEAQFWGNKLIPFAKKLIKNENIKYVIATGGPFMSNYWATVLKKSLPGIKLIQDLRDEWNETRRFIFKFHREKSYEYEKHALNNCNALVTTSIGLKEIFLKKISNKNIIKKIIYNGFDEDSIKKIQINKDKKKKRDFSFIYAGSLSNKRDQILDVFLNVVAANIKLFNKIKIYIYTPDCRGIDVKYDELVKNKILTINSSIPQDELFKLIYDSFVALHFMPESQNYIVSIKLFEYGILKRPVLSINAGGDSEYLINEHKLGYSVKYNDSDKIFESLVELYKLWQKDPYYKINPLGLEKYSYKNLSEEYLDTIDLM